MHYQLRWWPFSGALQRAHWCLPRFTIKTSLGAVSQTNLTYINDAIFNIFIHLRFHLHPRLHQFQIRNQYP